MDRARRPVAAATVLSPLALLALAGTSSAAEVHLQPGDSIQAAIDDPATMPGDEIVLAPGVYQELVDFSGVAVTLRSQDPADPAVVAATVLDGGGSGPILTMWSGEGRDTVVDGLTLRNAVGFSGGAMLVEFSSPTVRRCVFEGNESFFDGAGVMVIGGAPVIAQSRFHGNLAQYGAGVAMLDASAQVVDCVFSGNDATASGGAVDMFLAMDAVVAHSSFTANHAGRGGAVAMDSSSARVVNSVLWANSADDGSDELSAVYGSVLEVGGSVVAGSGGSAAWDAALGADLGDNLDADPMFADADGADDVMGSADDDLSLAEDSPARDSGRADLMPADVADLDGDGDSGEALPVDLLGRDRAQSADDGALVDMGAWEMEPPVTETPCRGDVDRDGWVDVNDFLLVIFAWGQCDGCREDLTLDGAVNWHDLLEVLFNWGGCPSVVEPKDDRHGKWKKKKRGKKKRRSRRCR